MKLKGKFLKLGSVYIQLVYSLVYFSILFFTINWKKKFSEAKSANILFGFTIGFGQFAHAFGAWGFHFGLAWPKRNVKDNDKFGFYKPFILKKRTLEEVARQVKRDNSISHNCYTSATRRKQK